MGNEKASGKGYKAAAHKKKVLPNSDVANAMASGRGRECGSVVKCLPSIYDVKSGFSPKYCKRRGGREKRRGRKWRGRKRHT